ncbi:MAG: LysR family transcriptional regulator [Pseudomonadota bacterium]
MKRNDPSIPTLRLVAAVAQSGSFAATARDRDMDPSLVSRQVAALEEALGFRLFERTTRRLRPTEAGRLYIGRIEPLLDEFEAARHEAQDVMTSPKGELRVTASVAFGERWLTPRLGGFCKAFPDISLELVLTDAVIDLVQENIDVAVRLAPRLADTLVAARLMDTVYRVVASPAHLGVAAPLHDPADLSDHSCLRLMRAGYRTLWRFRTRDNPGVTREIPVRGRIAMSNPLALRRAALDGLGPALLAHWAIEDDLKSGRLVDCFPDWDVSAADFNTAAWLVQARRGHVPGKTRAFIDYLTSAI